MIPQAVLPFEDASDLVRQSWDYLISQREALGLPDLAIHPVADFLLAAEQDPTSVEERQEILEQTSLMFEHLYPHMPFKKDIYHFPHPAEYLTENVLPVLADLTESDFHDFVVAAFSLVRDAHSLYGKPSPFRGAVAFLPFQMRHYYDRDRARYIVSRVLSTQNSADFGHPFFGPGAEILAWGAEPMENHVRRAASRLPGGNTSAIHTRGVIHCTVRPLTFVQLPFPDEMPSAVIYYTPAGRTEIRGIRMPWAVGTGFGARMALPSAAYSISAVTAASGHFGGLFQGQAQAPTHSEQDPNAVSTLPDVFEFMYTNGPRVQGHIYLSDLVCESRPDARFGYLRIKTFSDAQSALGAADRLVDEFQRILTIMDQQAPDGLVIDIRGNPGGEVEATERMLQMLTPGTITPQRFHLANTPALLRILSGIQAALDSKAPRSAADDSKLTDAHVELGAWLADAANVPFPAGERLTSGQPLTDARTANNVGQIYQGPVMLMVDGLTYSAADIFAAAFQDHGIGKIIGPDHTTGGGGATVWNHDDLLQKLGPDPGIDLKKLPRDASMSLAMRRSSRVESFQGQPVEDVGVNVDIRFIPESVDDVLQSYPSIIRRACQELAVMPSHRIDAGIPDAKLTLKLKSTPGTLKFYLNRTLALTAPSGQASYTLPPTPNPSHLRIELYASEKLVAVRNISLEDPTPVTQDDDTDAIP
ncbi:MAG TPA: S41 family peptidase [Candidatus Sulfopaludibacter sp.]|jgi:hypothetical protein|nr:S41 family peptidase [Candidatus Sulfopaludibacter sp.]